MTKIAKVTSRITAVLTLSFIAVISFATIFREKEKFSVTENRVLTDFPVLSAKGLLDGSDIEQLGNYITDHFRNNSIT